MGHTIEQWRAKVSHLLRDVSGVDVKQDQIEEVGLRPAFAEHSSGHPRVAVVEVEGAGSPYLDLPAGWEAGRSWVDFVEFPARQTTPRILDDRRWSIRRNDALAEKIWLNGYTPLAGQYVRIGFTTSWPFPTSVASADLLDDITYEAVAALAAAYCCESVAAGAARQYVPAMNPGAVPYSDRADSAAAAAVRFRSMYDRLVGPSYFVA